MARISAGTRIGGEVKQLLRSVGARVETRLTTSLEELDDALATAERRVVLLGGDGSLHAAANSEFRAELALIQQVEQGCRGDQIGAAQLG